jgi:hypothetical protein
MQTGELAEILLVEDNPADLEVALHALRRHHLANRIQVARVMAPRRWNASLASTRRARFTPCRA